MSHPAIIQLCIKLAREKLIEKKRASGKTFRTISNDTGIPYSSICSFFTENRPLAIKNIDKLTKYFEDGKTT